MIALTLGGRSVAEWQKIMSYGEFCEWVQFYSLHPFDDEHRFHRPAALISQSMAGGNMEEKLRWLKGSAGQLVMSDQYSDSDIKTMVALGLNFDT